MIKQLSKWFGRRPTVKPSAMQKEARPAHTGVAVQDWSRFDSAETDRLNAAHWSRATGQSLNSVLNSELVTLQNRCSYEYSSNPLFEGVVNSFCNDIVGRDGPGLQMESDNEQFNQIVKDAWAEVWATPEPRMRHTGPEVMKDWVRGLTLSGSYVNVYSTVDRADGLTSFGWQSVHARRLLTPPKHAGDPFVAFGIRIDEVTGRPVQYFIDATRGRSYTEVQGIYFDEFTAEQVNHVFIPVEPEQITGYPMLASTLGTAADLRQLSKTVMESMKVSAAMTPFLQATHPELVTGVDAIGSGCIPVEVGQANVAPAGYGWMAPPATQPTAQYQQFYNAKAAELGRPLHMPLMVVLLSVGDANFSSAQFEGGVYAEGVSAIQGVIERRTLKTALNRIVTELELRGRTAAPERWKAIWTWNVPPNANIEKQVAAAVNLVKAGLLAPSQATAMFGHDWEAVVAAREECEAELEAAGLPPTAVDGSQIELQEEQNEIAATSAAQNNNGGNNADRFANALGL